MKNPNLVIIDLRSPRDFEKDREFYTSRNLNVLNLDFFKAPKEVEILDRQKEYLVVCESGMLSDILTKVMQSKGFKSVKNVKGGIEELKRLLK
ncbi:MAG: rhodanese-like domain-containing protein [Spirochaetia bacterium]|nr:rhodanese-like domain-containing protein [Spirochaetota bacterium]MCX8096720.1 rhodanese-like domain-containing protein [Spirochaetota bacterium]MDW8112173.1 rhodanese-like domain-containing protein [Spirochaetia bacterium]